MLTTVKRLLISPKRNEIKHRKFVTLEPSTASSDFKIPFKKVDKFDYNKNYFEGTSLWLERDENTNYRRLIAREPILPFKVVLVTPYYNQVVHTSQLPHFCNACHGSLAIVGKENILKSKFLKNHFYCCEACRDRSAAIDEVMSEPLRKIKKLNPDFYVTRQDIIRGVLYTLSRRYLETQKQNHKSKKLKASILAPSATPSTHDKRQNPSETDIKEPSILSRPKILKAKDLMWSDYERLCELDVTSLNPFRDVEKAQLALEIDQELRNLLIGTVLSDTEVRPLDVIMRDHANAFSMDKYSLSRRITEHPTVDTVLTSGTPSTEEINDIIAMEEELKAQIKAENKDRPELLESSGFATFPLASYFNHSCKPNCCIDFDRDANIIITTTQYVEEDEELTISYNAGELISPLADLDKLQTDKNLMRRCKKMCRRTWGFECDC